jgi:hypothetical protein
LLDLVEFVIVLIQCLNGDLDKVKNVKWLKYVRHVAN